MPDTVTESLRKAGVTKAGAAKTTGGVSVVGMLIYLLSVSPSKSDVENLQRQLDRIDKRSDRMEQRYDHQESLLRGVHVEVLVLKQLRENAQAPERKRYE